MHLQYKYETGFVKSRLHVMPGHSSFFCVFRSKNNNIVQFLAVLLTRIRWMLACRLFHTESCFLTFSTKIKQIRCIHNVNLSSLSCQVQTTLSHIAKCKQSQKIKQCSSFCSLSGERRDLCGLHQHLRYRVIVACHALASVCPSVCLSRARF